MTREELLEKYLDYIYNPGWHFSRRKAVEYCEAHYESYSWKYPYYPSDCTNFASQVWQYAGMPETMGWHCFLEIPQIPNPFGGNSDNPYLYKGSALVTRSWNEVDRFYYYMISRGYATETREPSVIQEGDVVQFYDPTKPETDRWYHTAVISIVQDGQLYYAAHTTNCAHKCLFETLNKNPTYQVRFLVPIRAVP